jgi:hypothetical protein
MSDSGLDRIAHAGTRILEKDRRAREILKGVLATLVGDGDQTEGAAPAPSASLDGELLAYLRRLGSGPTLALWVTLYLIEYGTALWLGRLRPFTRLPPGEREAYLRGFEESRFYLRQRLLFPIRLLAMVLYYSDPEQEAATGYEFPTIDRSAVGEF